ncbi:MAG: hypothetical protein JXC32_19865, partial [Anaerolineae bacterium]|nr:hypothetical protein [Anaerolineae bacterium]
AYARDRGLHLVAPNPTTAAVTGDQARAQTIPTVARASDIVGDATAATQTETLKVVPTACLALTEASRIVMIEDPQPATTPAPACPGIETFTAETVAAPAGTGVTLTWQTRGDPRVTICPVIEDRVVGCRCLWNLPPSGTSVLSPNDIIARYSGFVLQLDGPEGCPAGDCVTETTDLAVACPPSAPPWFFEPEPAMCPDTPAVATAAAQQPFEGGTMIWTEAQDRYTILYDTFVPPSGTEPISASLKSLQILQGPLDLLPGASPDNRLGEPPPEGMAQPESGFGLVWRGEVAGSEHVRAHLGWARAPEQGFTAHIQCEVACGAHQACYLRDTQGNVLRISYLMHVGHIWDVVSPGHAAP